MTRALLLFSAIAAEDAEIRDGLTNIVLDPSHLHIYADGRIVEGKSQPAGAA